MTRMRMRQLRGPAIDLDGTLGAGQKLLPGAAELTTALQQRGNPRLKQQQSLDGGQTGQQFLQIVFEQFVLQRQKRRQSEYQS